MLLIISLEVRRKTSDGYVKLILYLSKVKYYATIYFNVTWLTERDIPNSRGSQRVNCTMQKFVQVYTQIYDDAQRDNRRVEPRKKERASSVSRTVIRISSEWGAHRSLFQQWPLAEFDANRRGTLIIALLWLAHIAAGNARGFLRFA